MLTRVAYARMEKGAPTPGAGYKTRQEAEDLQVRSETHSLRRSLFTQAEKQPDNAMPWILLGWSSADALSAAVYFQHALDIDPENTVALDGLTWARTQIEAASAIPDARSAAGQALEAPPARRTRFGIRDFRWQTLARFYYIPFFRNLGIAILYLLLISAAEMVTVLVDPTLGIILHASIMVGLLIQGSIIQQGPFRRYLIILALAPLIRLLSLSLPLAIFNIPIMYRYMIVGVPLFMAVYFSARSVGLTANRLYLTLAGWQRQLAFSLVGLVLGLCEYYILRPQALVPARGFDIFMGVLILFVFTGFLEEIIFRSLLQVTGVQLFGGIAIWIISLLFGILHIGYFSAFDVLFASVVGLMFGYFALKTRSLLGVSLAHGITNVTLYIILPLTLG
jgi:hypothetical protein